jgi:thioredoxin family protein
VAAPLNTDDPAFGRGRSLVSPPVVYQLPAMIVLALAGVLLSAPPLCSGPHPGAQASVTGRSDSLERLYDRGKRFAEFLAAVKSRRETWLDTYALAAPAGELLARARAVHGRWRLLVVAEDWCGDSANTIPYLAGLSDSVSSIELRVVSSQQGRWVMERHRTPDGRAATPTVVLLDSAGADVGCFVERPAALQEWLTENRPRLSERELQHGREAWRRKDAGQSTLREIIELLEAASAGTPQCGSTK